ncbi:GemA protein [Pseudomonas sp. BR1R-5]|uniref:gp16 family protein n=1 Tax=Pseudomonas sp. BR1R-5 TaxID=3003626 RepID=UPI0022C86946|nr:regulatory protein GemA [Pseudomonas sp. BR1R-5]GLH34034.1 GemA protein [Pseudomonas sp. BR1R-5]
MKQAPSNPTRLRLIKLIHVARRELQMDEDTYRLMLAGMPELGGATSTAKLSVPNLYRVLEALKSKGFLVRPNGKEKRTRAADPWSRKIRSLWLTLRDLGALRDASEDSLVKFVHGRTGAQALQWLTSEQASLVIEEMKKWIARIEQEGA